MEPIWKAVERAKAATPQIRTTTSVSIQPEAMPIPSRAEGQHRPTTDLGWGAKTIELDWNHLEAHRIIAHNSTDPRSKPFDMLRTQVLQTMDQRKWQFLAVTSPTANCGKTVTAINLAISIARQAERSALLVDLDLQKAHLASCLGLRSKHGVVSILRGHTGLKDAIIHAEFAAHQVAILPTEAPTLGSAELISSRAMSAMLQEIKREFPSHIVIFDLPPMLSGDDVLALLPQIDCVLLVAAVGTSTLSEVKECNKHLRSAEVVRVVLNKAADTTAQYRY